MIMMDQNVESGYEIVNQSKYCWIPLYLSVHSWRHHCLSYWTHVYEFCLFDMWVTFELITPHVDVCRELNLFGMLNVYVGDSNDRILKILLGRVSHQVFTNNVSEVYLSFSNDLFDNTYESVCLEPWFTLRSVQRPEIWRKLFFLTSMTQ